MGVCSTRESKQNFRTYSLSVKFDEFDFPGGAYSQGVYSGSILLPEVYLWMSTLPGIEIPGSRLLPGIILPGRSIPPGIILPGSMLLLGIYEHSLGTL